MTLRPKKVRSRRMGRSYFLLRMNIFTLNRKVLGPKKNFVPRRTGGYYKTSFKQAKPIPLLPFTKMQKFCTAVCCSSAMT